MAIKKNVPPSKLTYLRAQSELEAYIHTLSSPDILFGRVYKVFCSVTAGSSTGLSLTPRTKKSPTQHWVWTWRVSLNSPTLKQCKDETLPVLQPVQDCTVLLYNFLTVRQLYKFARQVFFCKPWFWTLSKASFESLWRLDLGPAVVIRRMDRATKLWWPVLLDPEEPSS